MATISIKLTATICFIVMVLLAGVDCAASDKKDGVYITNLAANKNESVVKVKFGKDLFFTRLIDTQNGQALLRGEMIFNFTNPFSYPLPLRILDAAVYDRNNKSLRASNISFFIENRWDDVVFFLDESCHSDVWGVCNEDRKGCDIKVFDDNGSSKTVPNPDFSKCVLNKTIAHREWSPIEVRGTTAQVAGETTLNLSRMNSTLIKIAFTKNSRGDYDVVPYLLINKTDFPALEADKIEVYNGDWAWFNDSWLHKKEVNVTNNKALAYTNFQLPLFFDDELPWDAVNDDLSDLRWTWNNAGSEEEISFFVEPTYVTNTNATIWVKIPTFPSSGMAQLWVYYNNTEASSVSSEADTLLFYDEFDTLSSTKWLFDSARWIYRDCPAGGDGGCVHHLYAASLDLSLDNMRAKSAVTSGKSWAVYGKIYMNATGVTTPRVLYQGAKIATRQFWCEQANDNCYNNRVYTPSGTDYGILFNNLTGGQMVVVGGSSTAFANKWTTFIFKFDKNNPYHSYWLNVAGTVRTQSNTTSAWLIDRTTQYPGISNYNQGGGYWDYLRLVQYAYPEPTWEIYAEEDAPVADCDFTATGDWIYNDGTECVITESKTKTSGNVVVRTAGSVLIFANDALLKLATGARLIVESGAKFILRDGGKVCGGSSCG